MITPDRAIPFAVRRRRVLMTHARIGRNGAPAVCGRPDAKQQKIIFDTADAALDAAAEFERMSGERQYAYPCPKSRRGHHHLTSERPAEPTL